MPLLFIKLISLRTLGVPKLNQSLFQKENIELHLFFFFLIIQKYGKSEYIIIFSEHNIYIVKPFIL